MISNPFTSPRMSIVKTSILSKHIHTVQGSSDQGKLLILSLCHHDVPFAIYYYHVYVELGYDVDIGTDVITRCRALNRLFSGQSLFSLNHLPTIQLNSDICSLTSGYHKVLIFTLGTYEICKAVHKALANKSQILYIDCYFKEIDLLYEHRLVDPVKSLVSSISKPQLSSRIQLIKQIIKQLLYDPFKKTYYFSADSHCWFTPRSLSLLHITKQNHIDYSSFKKTHVSPAKSIIFVFGVYDNLPISVDWPFWLASGFELYYKPHPNPAMSYQMYPTFVQPIFHEVSPLEIEFTKDSYMVGFYSTSLGYTDQSISLLLLHRSPPSPLRLAYASNAGHLPTSKSELQSLLSLSDKTSQSCDHERIL